MADSQAIAAAETGPVEGGGPKSFPAASPLHQAFDSGRYPYARLLGWVGYDTEKARLQAELLKVQIWAQDTGQKFVILMEGRDAAGKGGTIKRFMEHLNPRNARVRADQAVGSGKGPGGLPALYRASADGGGNGVLRPLLVQPGGCRADAGPVGHPAAQILVQRDAQGAARGSWCGKPIP